MFAMSMVGALPDMESLRESARNMGAGRARDVLAHTSEPLVIMQSIVAADKAGEELNEVTFPYVLDYDVAISLAGLGYDVSVDDGCTVVGWRGGYIVPVWPYRDEYWMYGGGAYAGGVIIVSAYTAMTCTRGR